VYETLPGWEEDISGCAKFDALPEAARKYVQYIEERTGVPVSLIGVGADRNQTIDRGF
jgi:adenylosuccinate synthase